MQAQNQTIRLLADEVNRSGMLDVNINATPQAWARAATQFEVGLNSAGNFLDVSNLASVTLEAALYSNRDGARVLSQTVAREALDNTVTAATWAAGDSQNALFVFSSAEMNIALNGATSVNLWMVISAITTAGDPIVFGVGTLTVADPGTLFAASAPPANPGAYMTIDQAVAQFAPIISGLLSVAGGYFQLAAADGTVFPVALEGPDAAPNLAVFPAGTFLPGYAFPAGSSGQALVRNIATGSVFPVLLSGPDAEPNFAVLPAGSAIAAITYQYNTAGQLTLLNQTSGNFLPVIIAGTDAEPTLQITPAT